MRMARLEPFWKVACDFRDYMWLGLSVLFFLFILTVVGLVLAPPGTASELISYVNLSIVLTTGAVVGGMYWVCVQRV